MTDEKDIRDQNRRIIVETKDELSEQELEKASGGEPPDPCRGAGRAAFEPSKPSVTKKG